MCASMPERRFLPRAGRALAGLAVASCLAVAAAVPARATLLVNGDLDDPPIHESDVATGWTLLEGPDSIDGTGTPYPTNTATFANFANHTPGGGRGLWLRAFVGGLGDESPDAVFAHLSQAVPGVPGLSYRLTAWSRWEAFYSGGLATPTQTLLAISFLDAASAEIGSTVLDLRTEQMNDNTWRQHELDAIAPAGTALVVVRASMIDGMFSPGNPQSAFFDDFELTAVPEPGTLALVLAGIAGLAAGGRRPQRAPTKRA